MKKVSRLLLVVLLSLFMGASAYAAGNDAHTVLLIQSDTTDGDATFSDSSVGGTTHSITANGGVHHETDQAQFGASSIYFDGSGDYLSIPDSEDWNFGSEDYTIDFWIYFNSYGGNVSYQLFRQRVGTTSNEVNLYYRKINDSPKYFSYYVGTTDGVIFAKSWHTELSLNQWYHVVLVKDATGVELYLDGFSLGKEIASFSHPDINSDVTLLGHSEDAVFNGYIDEFRISKGIARTENTNDPLYLTIDSDEDGTNDSFPVPTAPYYEDLAIDTLTPASASGPAPLTVDFEITAVGGTSPYTYSWDFDGDSVEDSTDQNPSYTYTSAGSYTATVTVTDDNGNTATGSIDVSVDQPLSIDSYSATPSTGTAPLTVEFSVTATGGIAPYTYAWDFDNDGIEDSTDQNPEYTYTSAYSGNANITVTDADENIVSQNISINISELTTEDCYASYNFLYDKFHVSCFAIEGEVYSFDMTINDVEIDESSIVKIK